MCACVHACVCLTNGLLPLFQYWKVSNKNIDLHVFLRHQKLGVTVTQGVLPPVSPSPISSFSPQASTSFRRGEV